MADPAIKHFDMLRLSLEALKTRTSEGIVSVDRTLVADDKRIREEYERKQAELMTSYQSKINDLRNNYETERRSTLLTSLEMMTLELRERSAWMLNPHETIQNIDQKIDEADVIIEMYNAIDLRRLPSDKAQKIKERFSEAKNTKRRYMELLEGQKKLSLVADAGVFIFDINQEDYVYPTLKFNDLQVNPSLMVNLLEYCLVSCDKAKIKYSLPEKENEFLRIRVEQGKRKKLIEMLISGQPERFREANLRFRVLNDQDYSLNPIEERVHEEKLKAEKTDIEHKPRIEQEVKSRLEPQKEYSEGEVMEMLGIPPRQYFQIHELKIKTGITGRKDKRVMTIKDIKRGEYKRRVNVKLFTSEEFEELKKVHEGK
jgi:hypothetical protein